MLRVRNTRLVAGFQPVEDLNSRGQSMVATAYTHYGLSPGLGADTFLAMVYLGEESGQMCKRRGGYYGAGMAVDSADIGGFCKGIVVWTTITFPR